MPNKHGSMGHGGPTGHGGGGADQPDHVEPGRGRSESSPGHLKKDAGARSARDFAPGNLRHADRGTVLPDAVPDDEMRGD